MTAVSDTLRDLDKRFRRQLREGQLAVRWRKIHQQPTARHSSDPPDIFSSTNAGPQQTDQGDYRIVWIRSSQKAALDRQVRLERLRAAEVELEQIARRIGARKLRSRKEIETRVRQLLGTHRARDFLRVRVVPFTEIEHRYLRPICNRQTSHLLKACGLAPLGSPRAPDWTVKRAPCIFRGFCTA